MSKEVKKEEAIAEGHFRISNLWKEEDWLAIWIGFIVISDRKHLGDRREHLTSVH